MKRLFYFISLGLLFAIGCQPSLPEDVASAYEDLPEKIDFNLHVRPILSDRCWSCHGQDEASREAGLRLDDEIAAFAPLTETKGYALVKGNLKNSQVFHRIITEQEDVLMPPPESNLTLSHEEKAILIKWIEQGAEWKEHWAFIPPEAPRIPKVKNEDWKQINEVDHFIQRKLSTKELVPAQEADKERLIRRVTMDLTGLPPTIGEIDAFLEDDSEEAYEKVIDRLLASDAHAERLSMEWMDLARYADSHGLHADGARIMWPWRDWVIKSFKENMPYNEFVTWQMAGDLMPNATQDQKLATAFMRNHPMTAEGGAVDEEFRLEYVFDRTNTTATAFLGLTMECARCHDHKFDPFSQDDFYQFSAFFNNIKELGMTGDDGNYGPMLMLPEENKEAKIQEVDAKIREAEKQLKLTTEELQAQGTFIKELASNSRRPKGRVGYFPFDKIGKMRKGKSEQTYFDGNRKVLSNGKPELVEGKFDQAVSFPTDYDEVYLEKMGLFEMNESFSVSAWIYTTEDNKEKTQVILGNAGDKNNFWRGWDLYLDEENRLAARLIHSLPHNYIHTRTKQSIPLNTWTHVAYSYDGSAKANGLKLFVNGLAAESKIEFDQLYKSIYPVQSGSHTPTDKSLRVGKSYRSFTGENGFFKGYIDDISIFDRQLTSLEMTWLGDIEPGDAYNEMFEAYKLANQRSIKNAKREIEVLRGERLDLVADVMEVMVMEEMPENRPMHVLNRGVYDQPQHEVKMGTPNKVLTFPEDLPKNRLGLAQWLFTEKNPLTARVTVNRYWQMIFGQGLVTTPDDFGSQGALPSHPELLDHLAVKFRDSNWDIRALLKDMVMSYTYRQSSITSPELAEVDPGNIWLARSPSYRLPAEMIRDNALAASGLLVNKIGGASVKPYQPEGLWIDLGNFSYDLLRYKEDEGDKLYRRSLYTFIRRTSPPPFMTTFDVPSRDKCAVQREQTNTPLQALILLNDPQFVEASRVLAARMQKEGGETLDDQIRFAFRSTTGRKPLDGEVAVLKELFETEKSRFAEKPSEAKKVLEVGRYPHDRALDYTTTAALAVVANTILNHDEAYVKR